MSPAPTYSLPALGSDTSVSDPLIRQALSDLKTLLTDGLDEDNIDSLPGSVLDAASVADSKLASPNNSVYRTLLTSRGLLTGDAAGNTYPLGFGPSGSIGLRTNGSSATAAIPPPDLIYFDDADYAVSGLTQKLRLRAQVAANATAPAITFTFGLYPVTVAGGADATTYTLGTVVSGSTVAIASPSASTVTAAVNSDFTVPADGAYALGVLTSGTLADNASVGLHAILQTRNV